MLTSCSGVGEGKIKAFSPGPSILFVIGELWFTDMGGQNFLTETFNKILFQFKELRILLCYNYRIFLLNQILKNK